MATYPFLPLVVLSFTLSFTEALNSGFSVELIHRDSTKSPFYNPTETRSQRMTGACQRSFNRVNRFYPTKDVPKAKIASTQLGEYFMRYSIGTPQSEILGTFDTGSDLIWSQCKPCATYCYKQTTPMFDPSKSTTYNKTIPCNSKLCQSLAESSCYTGNDAPCQYAVAYGDGSSSSGNLAFETLTLRSPAGKPISFPNIPYGCGHDNRGNFPPEVSGIVGLGGGLVSLTSQIGPSIDFKFSYCLVPSYESNTTSKLNFGQNAVVVAGSGVVSTPLVPGPYKTFYYLTLQGVSVGPKRIEFSSKSTSSAVKDGNIIIDSGTTLTILPNDFYTKLESEVAAQIKLVRVKHEMLNLCYKATPNTIKAPMITAHFTGADVVLNTVNTFLSVSEDVVCFAFTSLQSGGAIFGNLAQANFLVGFDLQKKAVSFMPADCSKL